MNHTVFAFICLIFSLAQSSCSGVMIRSNDFPLKEPALPSLDPGILCLSPPNRGDDEIAPDDNQNLPKSKRRTHLTILQEEFARRNIKSMIAERDDQKALCKDTIIFENIQIKTYYRNIHGVSTLSLLTLYLIPDWTKYKVAEIEFTDGSGRYQTQSHTLVIDWIVFLPVTFFNKLFFPHQSITDNSYIWSKFTDFYLAR